MNKKFKPFLAHSELTDCIYIIYENDKYEVTEQCIKAMKATNRMPRWIPVSEQLPIKSDYYLATIKESSGEKVVRSVWYDGEWKLISVVPNVIAWMSLPEPYKASPTGAEGSDKE